MKTMSAIIIKEALRRKQRAVKEDIAAGRINLKNEAGVELTEQFLDLVAQNYVLLQLKDEARKN